MICSIHEGSDLLKILRKDGWILKNQEGSHRQFTHPKKSGKVAVSGHESDEIKPKTLKSMQTRRAKMKNMMKYAVIFEGDPETGYSAYAPDLPGCIATGRTLDETRELMQGAIEFHLRGMREDGDPIPEPSHIEMLEVA
jgi:predicted RNase H-like HicB family nuclease/predicted RNA binding protein YcfA (HicA-like mRNA interferase family)